MRVQSPISGNMSGSLGGLVLQHYHGRTFARSKPTFFHYKPTPAQYAAQSKYYGIRQSWNPIYQLLKPYISETQLKQANAYNNLSQGIFEALGVFDASRAEQPPLKFGFDAFDRLSLRLGNWTLYYTAPYYYVTFYDFDFASKVDFTPIHAHALMLCPDLQQLQYSLVDYDAEHLTFVMDNSNDWFPSHYFNMYVALSDEQYMSNFFF